MGANKTYTGTICLGATTPSYDLEKEVILKSDPSCLSKQELKDATKQFLGHIQQKPPIFSAIKHKGKRLYEHARAGEQVNIQSREVIIHEFDITNINLPDLKFRIRCGKGTYIRSIANDFGEVLGVGGYLKSLCRTAIGNHTIADSMSIDTFERNLKARS